MPFWGHLPFDRNWRRFDLEGGRTEGIAEVRCDKGQGLWRGTGVRICSLAVRDFKKKVAKLHSCSENRSLRAFHTSFFLG
jgi:hypothetical protein